MNGSSISSGCDNKSGTSVEDGSAAAESGALAVDGNRSHGAFPESLLIDIREGDQGCRIKLRGIKTTKGNFTIVLLVSNPGDLVGGDSIRDETVLSEGFHGCESFLLG